MIEAGMEAGELSDRQLDTVTGGAADPRTVEGFRETADSVNHIQEMLAGLASSGAAKGAGTGTAAPLTKDEAQVVKQLGALVDTFEKAHDLARKSAYIAESEKNYNKISAKAKTETDIELAKIKTKDATERHDKESDLLSAKTKTAKLALEQETAKIVGSTGRGVSIISAAEAEKLARAEQLVAKLAGYAEGRKPGGKATVDAEIGEAVGRAKAAGQPYPDKEVTALKKVEQDRVTGIQKQLDQDITDTEKRAKSMRLPYPKEEIEELRQAAKAQIDPADDGLPRTRTALLAELKTLTTDFAKLERDETAAESKKPMGGITPAWDIKTTIKG